MYKIRRPSPSRYLITAAAIGLGAALIAAVASAQCAVHRSIAAASVSAAQAGLSPAPLVQDNDDDADSEVPPDQVEKYVAVYTAMQHNRSLTVDAAAAKEGLTVAEFRNLEQKIERDDIARDRVRTELQAAAARKP